MTQLDVYGEVADAPLHGYLGYSAQRYRPGLQEALTDHLVTIWEQGRPWNLGSPRRTEELHLFKGHGWVAFDRALKIAKKFGLRGVLAHWREVRDQTRRYICDNCFDRQLQAESRIESIGRVVAAYPTRGLPVSDYRVQATVAAIERQLMINGLLVRYRTEIVDDGLPAGEGVFLACSFWLVSVLKMMGRGRGSQEPVRFPSGPFAYRANQCGLRIHPRQPTWAPTLAVEAVEARQANCNRRNLQLVNAFLRHPTLNFFFAMIVAGSAR